MDKIKGVPIVHAMQMRLLTGLIVINSYPLQISYSTTTKEGSLRTVHTIKIDGEQLITTRAKEVLIFAKPRIFSKHTWKTLKECVRLGESLEVMGVD